MKIRIPNFLKNIIHINKAIMIIATTILIILNIVLYINSYLLHSRIDNNLTAYTPTREKRRGNVYIQLRRINEITFSEDNVNIFVFSFKDSQNIPDKYFYFQYKSATFEILSRTSHSVTGKLLIGTSDNVIANNAKTSSTFLFFV